MRAPLAARLELPLLELDAVFHAQPNWVDLTREEFRDQVTAYLAAHRDGWVIEGNYSHVRDLILPLAETAVWLDLPFLTVYRRLAWRTISPLDHGRRTLEQATGKPFRQTFLTPDSMLVWGIKSWQPHRRSLIESLYTDQPAARVYHLRTPGQVRYLLANAQAAATAP